MLPHHSAPTPLASSQACTEVERLLEKERFKEAVKQAKLCYSEESTPENHRLLERAYYLRARQLIEFGMSSSAVEVARHLLEFGVTGGECVDQIVRVLMDLGLRDQAYEIQERLGEPAMKEQLVAMAADRAVIHPDAGGDESGEFAREAKLIRESLSRLQAKDEPGALLVLRDLARSSVLSEWKFFVRGLAAYYRGDSGENKANWDRLDPKRKAYRIAQRLREFTEVDGSDTADERIKALEKLAYREPILDRLRELNTELASQDWNKIFARVGSLRQSLRRIDQKLAERLTVALTVMVVREAASSETADAKRILNGFIRVAEPTAIDPRWNRLWALMWDASDDTAPSVSLDYWGRYLEDLKMIPILSDQERALAQAMVWNRMALAARDLVAELEDDDDTGPFGLPMPVRPTSNRNVTDVLAARIRVVDCLEKSLALAPLYRPTYELLVEVYRSWDSVDNFVAAARRLLAKFPDDLDTLVLLAEHFTKNNNDPAAALPLVVQAREIKPLDESLRELEWMIRVDLAQPCARQALGPRARPVCRRPQPGSGQQDQLSLSGPEGDVRGQGRGAGLEQRVSRASARLSDRTDASVAGAGDRVDPLSDDQSNEGRLHQTVGSGFKAQTPGRDRWLDGRAFGSLLESRRRIHRTRDPYQKSGRLCRAGLATQIPADRYREHLRLSRPHKPEYRDDRKAGRRGLEAIPAIGPAELQGRGVRDGKRPLRRLSGAAVS